MVKNSIRPAQERALNCSALKILQARGGMAGKRQQIQGPLRKHVAESLRFMISKSLCEMEADGAQMLQPEHVLRMAEKEMKLVLSNKAHRLLGAAKKAQERKEKAAKKAKKAKKEKARAAREGGAGKEQETKKQESDAETEEEEEESEDEDFY